MSRFIAIIILIFFKANSLFPQNYIYKFDKYTTDDGLSSNTITSIIKDADGMMWIGTIDGLNRFDGYNLKIFHPQLSDPASISDSWINCILDDYDCLWVGTPNGLNRFDKATEQFKKYRFSPYDSTSISNDYVTTVYCTKKNKMWIGTEDGLNLFDKTTGEIKRYKSNPGDFSTLSNNFIKTIYEDKEGYLWIGTYGGGLNRFDEESQQFKHYTHNPKNPLSLSNNFIEGIVEDSTGNIWIATNGGGVNKFDKQNEIFFRYEHNPTDANSISGNNIKGISLGKDQTLWFGIYSEGISIFDPAKNRFTNLINNVDDASSVKSVNKIYTDENGSIWICTSNGINVYNKQKWKFNHYRNIPGDENSLSSNEVISICDDTNGNIWVATKAGLQILDRNTGSFRKKRINDVNNVIHLFRDKKDFIWISTSGGPIVRYDSQTDAVKQYYGFNGEGFNSRCIFEDSEENLWIGSWTGGGITVLDKDRNFKKKYLNKRNDPADFTNTAIYDICQDSKGNIWVATYEGLIMLDPLTEKIIIFKNNPENPNTLSDNRVTGITEDKNGYLWITTYGEGLNKFDPVTKKFNRYIEDWLAADIIVGVLKDDNGHLWLANYKGISKFDIDNESFTNYGLGDGVQGEEFSFGAFYKTKVGEIYFGGTNGFNSFYPNSISENKIIPKIIITNFKIFNKEAKLEKAITETKEISISHKENFFSFDFAALDYTNPDKNQYAYMLEGIDENWNYVGNVRTAHYTDIAPGEYIFKVKGSNNDGAWNENPALLKLIITPPFYKTLWFLGLAVFLSIGGIGYIFSRKLQLIKKEKNTQIEFMKKLLESQENERKRIAAELHDSLGQHLLILKSKAQIISKKTDDNLKIKNQLDEISELSSSTLDEVRKISYNLRPYELDRLGLTRTLISMIDNVNESTNINFDIEIDDIDKMADAEIEINIYRIIQEILNNIIKHSNATEVSGNITYLEKEILICISDNGKGFSFDKNILDSREKGFGLKGISERVKLFGGIFKIDSGPGKGTEIKISIPF